MKKQFIIEQVKNVIIVALLTSAVLLLYLFWTDVKISDVIIPIEKIIEMDTDTNKPTAEELIKPNEIVVSFGTEDYTKTTDSDILNSFFNCLKTYFENPGTSMEEITNEQYTQIMEYKSIELNYGYNIPLNEFFQKNLGSKANISSITDVFSKLAYSAASPDSLFLYNIEQDVYYRLIVDANLEKNVEARIALETAIDSLTEKGYTSYYKADTFFGGDNPTLIPYALQDVIIPKQYVKNLKIDDTKRIKTIEEQFFGSTLDFVRKITENKGSLLYMYGYSQKVLMINEQGLLEYSEELDTANYEEKGFYESLNMAIEYISAHCGWDEAINENQTVILKKATAIRDSSDRRRGYNFTFGIMTAEFDVYYYGEAEDMMTIDIFGNQVTKYTRDIISVNSTEETERGGAESPINILTNNYELISQNIDLSGDEENTEGKDWRSFDNVIDNIKYMAVGYFRNAKAGSSGKNELVPCWRVEVGGTIFYFDTQNGTLLSMEKGKI